MYYMYKMDWMRVCFFVKKVEMVNQTELVYREEKLGQRKTHCNQLYRGFTTKEFS